MNNDTTKTIRCESANGCNNRIPADKKPFEDSERRLCLPCTFASYY